MAEVKATGLGVTNPGSPWIRFLASQLPRSGTLHDFSLSGMDFPEGELVVAVLRELAPANQWMLLSWSSVAAGGGLCELSRKSPLCAL